MSMKGLRRNLNLRWYRQVPVFPLRTLLHTVDSNAIFQFSFITMATTPTIYVRITCLCIWQNHYCSVVISTTIATEGVVNGIVTGEVGGGKYSYNGISYTHAHARVDRNGKDTQNRCYHPDN